MAINRADFADTPRASMTPAQARRFLKARAQESAGAIADDITRAAKAVLLNALKGDKTSGQVLFELDQALADWLPDRDAAGKIVNVPARVETIARTLTAESVNEARYSEFTDPDLQGFVEAFMYTAILDDRVRETHAAWDSVTRPVDDEIWYQPDRRPPDGFNCRCTLLAVTAADTVDLTPDDELPLDTAGPDVFPDVGFR